MRSLPTHLLAVTLPLFLIFLTGCASTAYNQAWRNETQPGNNYNSLEGPWTGSWESTASGHNGRLRCLVHKVPGQQDTYDFHYWATFLKVLSAQYKVRYTAARKNGVYQLSGEQDLGAFGGVYSHRGEATAKKFHSTYRAEKDHGTFEMRRP